MIEVLDEQRLRTVYSPQSGAILRGTLRISFGVAKVISNEDCS